MDFHHIFRICLEDLELIIFIDYLETAVDMPMLLRFLDSKFVGDPQPKPIHVFNKFLDMCSPKGSRVD